MLRWFRDDSQENVTYNLRARFGALVSRSKRKGSQRFRARPFAVRHVLELLFQHARLHNIAIMSTSVDRDNSWSRRSFRGDENKSPSN